MSDRKMAPKLVLNGESGRKWRDLSVTHDSNNVRSIHESISREIGVLLKRPVSY